MEQELKAAWEQVRETEKQLAATIGTAKELKEQLKKANARVRELLDDQASGQKRLFSKGDDGDLEPINKAIARPASGH